MNTQGHQGYRVSITPVEARVRVERKGVTLADSAAALLMQETRLSPVYYFPRADVRMELLQSNPSKTHCPFKGNASYFDLADGTADKLAWSYEDGFDEAALVREYIAFDGNEINHWYLNDDPVELSNVVDSVDVTNPFVHWLLKESWKATSIQQAVEDLALVLRGGGMKLWRLRLFVRTLNPQLYAKAYTWQLGKDHIEEYQATHKGVQEDAHLNSPFVPIINGEGGIRRNLEGDDPLLDYPVLHDLLAEGATDYVALPVLFSDQQINILSLVSNEPGGFLTSELGYLYEILPHVGRLVEAHAQRESAQTLLQTYLGRNAGQRVMSGLVRRGDGEDIDAVIWFSDLRNSTAMADSMDRMTYLSGLDQYFDCVAGAVVRAGGEVLKFIGDAILAIFPLTEASLEDACARAVSALESANEELARVNNTRESEGLPVLAFGTGLHRGQITYGNIGAEARLDFTVIGPAVNEASRIEGLCKPLGHPVIASANFAEGLPSGKRSIGTFELAGVSSHCELFVVENAGTTKPSDS